MLRQYISYFLGPLLVKKVCSCLSLLVLGVLAFNLLHALMLYELVQGLLIYPCCHSGSFILFRPARNTVGEVGFDTTTAQLWLGFGLG